MAANNVGALLRLPLLPRQRHPRSRHQEAQPVRRRDPAGRHARAPCRRTRHALLHRQHVPAPTTRTTPSSPGAARGTATKKFGYDVVLAKINGAKATITPFMTGFLDPPDRRVLGPAGRRACRCRTARCWSPTSRTARSIASPIRARLRRKPSSDARLHAMAAIAGVRARSRRSLICGAAEPGPRRRRAAGAAAAVRHLPRRERQLQDGEDAVAGRAARAVPDQPADPVSRAAAQVGGDGAVRQGPDGCRDRGAGGALRQAARRAEPEPVDAALAARGAELAATMHCGSCHLPDSRRPRADAAAGAASASTT